jgi:Protein of unknown function (DUF2809)/ER-bound oxygenase mpaB/B'/Rubber oxygenase, catalytic domain
MLRFRFRGWYFLLSLLLLGVEIFIAVFMHDRIIRPYGGDFLVVIWLYCLVRSFWDLPVPVTAALVLLFSYLVEASQYFHLADRLGFKGRSLMRVILGSYFTWTDILSYTLGILFVLGVEGMIRRRGKRGDGESIVRRIWGSADTVLLVFAGAAAEFALNRSVDWLYYTGRLPADPIGRLFSTVRYAQQIVWAKREDALAAIDRITAIHKGVEASRGFSIPDSAYLDVLFLLIDYSIRSFELLERKCSEQEKADIFGLFYEVGARMGLRGLPADHENWIAMRSEYLAADLVHSKYTTDLYRRYRISLGPFRYRILLYMQALLAPQRVRRLLSLPSVVGGIALIWLYKGARFLGLDALLKAVLLPAKYKRQVANLDRTPVLGSCSQI